MMDEIPSEATIPVYGEEVDKNSIMCEALPSQVKEESFNHCHSIKLDFTMTPPLLETEKRMYYCPMRSARRAEMSMKRNIKKLEEVFTNRGLPLDQGTLRSAASKDPFDMGGLNESLPSTSETKPDVIGFRGKYCHKLESYPFRMRHNGGRFEGIRCSLSGYSSELGRKLDALRQKASDSMEEKDMTNIKTASFQPFLRRLRRGGWGGLKAVPVSDSQIQTDEDGESSMEGKALQDVEDHLAVTYTVLPTSKISPGEEKSSDVENNLPPPFQSDWDSKKIWTTDFHSSPLSVPLNSPTKMKSDSHKFETLKKMVLSLEIEGRRKENKLQLLNSHRGDLSTEMDESESENISKETPKPTNHYKQSCCAIRVLHKVLHASTEMSLSDKAESTDPCKKLLAAMQEHHERMKFVRSYCRLTATKNSDKVVPD